MTDTLDPQFWDEFYRSREQLFSGRPNGALVDEAAALAPGRALDLGCGEGADAHWLAERGWQVTAVDLAEVALQRAAAADHPAITWQRADLLSTPPPAASFALVSAQYFPIPRELGPDPVRGLIEAVAPGGTLLVTAHDPADVPDGHDFDPHGFVQPAEIAELLEESWTVLVHERRERSAPTPDTPHVHDLVLRAQRA